MEQIFNVYFYFFMISLIILCKANEHRPTKEQYYSWTKLEHTLIGFDALCQNRIQKHNQIILLCE